MKPRHRKATLAAASVFVLVLFLSWAGGYDFDERGFTAVFTSTLAIVFSVGAYVATLDLTRP